jgi:hypothetical protein
MIRMASVEQALALIVEQSASRRLGAESVPLAQAFGAGAGLAPQSNGRHSALAASHAPSAPQRRVTSAPPPIRPEVECPSMQM